MLQQSTNTNTKRSGDLLPVQSSKRFKADDAQFDGDAQLSGDARPDEPRGQFAHLVRSETRPAHSAASPATTSFSSKDRETDSVRTKPDFQKFVASHLKRPPVSPGGLYDMLPPEKSRQSH